MKLAVVIPAYNEEGNIRLTIEELIAQVKGLPQVDSCQIIVVDDCSKDNTFQAACALIGRGVSCISLSRHSGSHIALRAGLREARDADAVLFISADGQDDSSCLKGMLEKWRLGAKVVWALRRSRDKDPWYVKAPAALFYRLLSLSGGNCGSKIDISRGNFFLLDKEVVEALNSCPERNTSIFGLVVWAGFNQDYVEYERNSRRFGESKWNFSGLFSLAKDWIIAFSDLPLKCASFLGIIMSILGVLGAAYIVMDKLFFSRIIPGWTSIVVLILLLGGIQLIILGVIGEYLWRTLDESRRRPLFFIERRSHAK